MIRRSERISKKMYFLEPGTIIYRESTDCSYHKILAWSEIHRGYKTVVLDGEGNETDFEDLLLVTDLIGDYIV